MNKINTLLVEDHEITRLGLKKMLEAMDSISLVGEAVSGTSAVEKSRAVCPDLVLMDIGLPEMDGIEASRLIKKISSTKIVIITSHADKEDLLAALSAGADAYCLKDVSRNQLSNCIMSVIEGATWLDPTIARHLQLHFSGATRNIENESKNSFQLSSRENEILHLLVEGHSNKQMAEKLSLSPETIKTHMKHVMEKLGVTDRTQAAIKAVAEKLLRTERVAS